MSIDDLTKEKSMKEIIGQLAGSASLCWSPRPTGVFDSEQASKFVEEASAQLLALVRDEVIMAKVKLSVSELSPNKDEVKEIVAKVRATQEANLIKLFNGGKDA